MTRQNGPENSLDQDDRGWEEGESVEGGPVAVGVSSTEVDEEAGVTVDDDLDEIDGPLDPDFSDGEAWEIDDLELDLDLPDDEEEDAEALHDDAEILLLQEFGIDLDAPDEVEADREFELDLVFSMDREETADDGVAA